MSKSPIDRLNDTLNQIPRWGPQLFAGYNSNKIRSLMLKKVQDHFTPADMLQLSSLLSFGGVRIIKKQSVTDTRHIKRLLLLFHRVLGYHTQVETESLKSTMKKMNQQEVLTFAKPLIGRSMQFLTSRETWAREIPQRFGGRLVHYYSQSEDARLKDSDLSEHGWCLGMSVQWLACKAARTDFWQNHVLAQAAGQYRFVMAGQSVRIAGLAGSGMDDRAAFRLKRFGLVLHSTTRENVDPQGQIMARNIANSNSQFCRIGQYYKSGGGHAMAATRNGGNVVFMDPNLGEFAFEGNRFQQWFPLFTRFMGYVFKKHYVEHFRSKNPARPIDPQLANALRARRAGMGYDN